MSGPHKNTEDDPYGVLAESARLRRSLDAAERARDHSAAVQRVVRWFVVSVGVGGLLLGAVYLALWMHDRMVIPDWNAKVDRCAADMELYVNDSGPIPSCEKLNEDGQREAAYRWAHRTGRL